MFNINEKSREASRFLSHVRDEIQRAFIEEKRDNKLTQQAVAEKLGVNRSVINRQLKGEENLTLRTVAELAWAMGWKPKFELVRRRRSAGSNYDSTFHSLNQSYPSSSTATKVVEMESAQTDRTIFFESATSSTSVSPVKSVGKHD
jgi:DNA-binding phage protein